MPATFTSKKIHFCLLQLVLPLWSGFWFTLPLTFRITNFKASNSAWTINACLAYVSCMLHSEDHTVQKQVFYKEAFFLFTTILFSFLPLLQTTNRCRALLSVSNTAWFFVGRGELYLFMPCRSKSLWAYTQKWLFRPSYIQWFKFVCNSLHRFAWVLSSSILYWCFFILGQVSFNEKSEYFYIISNVYNQLAQLTFMLFLTFPNCTLWWLVMPSALLHDFITIVYKCECINICYFTIPSILYCTSLWVTS